MGMDKEFRPKLDNACNYFAMLRIKLIHVDNRGHWIGLPARHWDYH